MSDQIKKLDNATTLINLSRKFRTIPLGKTNILVQLEELKNLRRDCLNSWIQSSLGKSVEKVAELGYKNRKGKPYSIGSVRKYALDFIIYYPDDARELYKAIGEFLDNPQADKDWLWHVINIGVRQLKSKQAFIRWAVKNNFYKKGFHLFKDLYNLDDDEYTAFDGLDDDK